MFDFEKLDLYQVVRDLNVKAYNFILKSPAMDEHIKEEWKKASLRMVTSLAEGVGSTTNEDKRRYITIARGSVFQCVTILQALKDLNIIEQKDYEDFYNEYETASKMLLGMFRSFK